MESASTLLWGLLFGSIGFAYFVYGKKQTAFVPILSGIGLMAFPYFVSNPYGMVLAGIILMALPYFIKG